MKNKPSHVGAGFADEYLGHEENIVMNVEDARYRYYQWLRGWFGLRTKEATNKCPFYQFMFWGSLVMLASIVPIIIMKIIDIFVLWPLSWIAPDFVDEFNTTAAKSKMVFSWIITCILLIIAIIVGALLSSPILAWIGLVIHWIYAVPWLFTVGIWLGIVFLITDGIPWIFAGIVFVLEAIFAVIIALINVPWLSVLLWIMTSLGVIAGTAAVFVIFYKLIVWFFKSSFTAWVIRKSCDIREFRIRKGKEHKVKVHKRKKEKKKRKLELKEAKPWKDPNERWDKILIPAFELIWAGLRIFPGYPLKWIAYVLILIFNGFVLVGLGLGWFGKKIWDIVVVVWSLITETISNHCPPIEFIVGISEEGELIPQSNGDFKFTSENVDGDILFAPSELPDGFKPSKAKNGRPATIRCTIRKTDLESAKRSIHVYGNYGNTKVHEIQDLKYILHRTTRKK